MDKIDVMHEDALLEEKDALLAILLAEEGFDIAQARMITARNTKDNPPLSFAQERLWLLDQLMPGIAAYNIPTALRLTGPLNIAPLEQSLNEIIQRHEVLRTTFAMVDGQPVQVIAATLQVPLPLVDLRALPQNEREVEALHLSKLEAKKPFDLSQGPLLRTTLLQLAVEEHILLLTMHHIVSDGWSMSIFYRELAAFYDALSRGRPSPLAALPIQYADFASWQRNWLQGEVLEDQLRYWRQQLKGAPVALNLPTDRPRPAVQTFEGATYSVVLPALLRAELKAVSQREGVTLFMTLLAAFQILLLRYTGQEDISVGTFIAGRNQVETEELIGFFINNLVLRTNLSGNPSFRELLRRVSEVTLGAYAHQDVPFEKLIQELHPDRDLSNTPLFQVMLVFQNMPKPILALPGLSVHATNVESGRSNFDLSLWVTEELDGLTTSLQYNINLFEAATTQRMLQHLQTLLQAIVTDLDQRVFDLPLLTGAECRQLLVDRNAAEAEYATDVCLHQLFEAQVVRTPDAVAVVWEDEQLTYLELNRRSNQLAHHLRRWGVGPEVRVGICMKRSVAMIVGLLGTLKAGGGYVPLDPAYPKERLAFILEDTQATVVLTQQKLLQNLPTHTAQVVCLDLRWHAIAQESKHNLCSMATAENVAYVMYTSGSTGRPKGAVIQHRSVVSFAEAAWRTYGLEVSDRILQFASISFDISVEEIYPCLAHGATLVLRTDTMVSSIPLFLGKCREWGLTVLDLPTAYWHELSANLDMEGIRLPSSIRLVIIGGERALPEWLIAWRKHCGQSVRLVNTYGPTEATVVVTTCMVEEEHTNVPVYEVPIGRAIRNAQVYILDRYLQPVPIGVPGELCIGGGGLARGYLNHPGLTAEKFIPNPFSGTAGARLYKTGDLARYLADGTMQFLGRLDDQVKMRGFRVELGEVEVALQQHPSIREAVVIAREDIPGEKRLVAYIVCKQEQAPTINDLRRHLKETLPEYMIPSTFFMLKALPLMPNGKIDRHALPMPKETSHERQATFVAPRDTLELQLARIWEELLNIHPIGVTDNFFDMGGHSLLAVRLLAHVQKLFAKQLPLSTLFQGATIEQLAQMLRQQADSVAWSPLVGIQLAGSKRPFFCIHPAGGNILCYVDLARHLRPDQPVYGLQAQGLDGEAEPITCIEDMAALYIEMLRVRQPEGPYLLGGWSMGGVVAFEMALQLQKQGYQVDLLALLDSPALFSGNKQGGKVVVNDDAALLARFVADLGEHKGQELAISYENLRWLGPDDQLRYVLEQAKKSNIVPADAGSSQIHRLLQVYKANVRAVQSYKPQVYPGHITYFQPEQSVAGSQDTITGWREVAAGGLEICALSGGHYTMIKEPYVRVLAAQLKACLDKVQPHMDE